MLLSRHPIYEHDERNKPEEILIAAMPPKDFSSSLKEQLKNISSLQAQDEEISKILHKLK